MRSFKRNYDGENWVYRLYGPRDRLLYVGVTNNLQRRLAQHWADKSWWDEVVRYEAVPYHGQRQRAEGPPRRHPGQRTQGRRMVRHQHPDDDEDRPELHLRDR